MSNHDLDQLPESYLIGPVTMRAVDLGTLPGFAGTEGEGEGESEGETGHAQKKATVTPEEYARLPHRKLMVAVHRMSLTELLNDVDVRPHARILDAGSRRKLPQEEVADDVIAFVDKIAVGEIAKIIKEKIPRVRGNYDMFISSNRSRLVAARDAKNWALFRSITSDLRDLIGEALRSIEEFLEENKEKYGLSIGEDIHNLETTAQSILTSNIGEMRGPEAKYDPRNFVLGKDDGGKYLVWRMYAARGDKSIAPSVVVPVQEAVGSEDYFFVEPTESNRDFRSVIQWHMMYVGSENGLSPIAFPANVKLRGTDRVDGWMVFAPFLPTFLDLLQRACRDRNVVFAYRRRAGFWVPDLDFVFPRQDTETDYAGRKRRRGNTTLDLLTAVGKDSVGIPADVAIPRIEGYPVPQRPISTVELAFVPMRPIDVGFLRKVGFVRQNPKAAQWKMKVGGREILSGHASVVDDVYLRMTRVMSLNARVAIHAMFGVPGAGYNFPPAEFWATTLAAFKTWVSDCKAKTKYRAVAARAEENRERIAHFYLESYSLLERNREFLEEMRKVELVRARKAAVVAERERAKEAAGKSKIREAIQRRKAEAESEAEDED